MRTLDFIINGCETARYHTWPTLRVQDVGNHSARVALTAAWIAGDQPPGISVPLLMAALCHDLAEHLMGDMPAPVKRAMPDYTPAPPEQGGSVPPGGVPFREVWDAKEQELLQGVGLDWEHMLSDIEKRWLKLADAADGCFYCIRERAMGNKLIRDVWDNFRGYVASLVDETNEREVTLLEYIDSKWEEADV